MEIKGIGDKGIVKDGASIREEGKGADFSKTLKEAIKKVDSLQKEADEAVKAFASGKVDLHKAMIAIEKANISFQFMVQVRNKILSAYEEVMRMQV